MIVLLGQLTNVEHFMQCRMEEAVYFNNFMMTGHYCVSVPFDKLVGMYAGSAGMCCLFYCS